MVYKTLKEISKNCKGYYGIGASSCDFNKNFPQYLRITDIADDGRIPKTLPSSININKYPDYKNYYLQNGDLLLARTGNSTGRNHLYKGINNSTVFAGFLIKFSINKNIVNPYYVGYYCQSKQYYNQIESLITGSTRPNINAEQYGNLLIPIADFPTQQHIVDTIGSVDDLIEKNEETIEKIEHYLLLKFSVYEKKNAMISISDFTKCYNGGAFKSKEYVQFSNKKLITIKNVDDNGFNTSSVDYLNENIDNKYLLNIGDIIMTMTGNVGRVGIVSENNCYLNQRVLKIESICQIYLYCYLKKHILDIISLGRGTAQKNLSLVDFQNMPVFNTINEINEFNNNATFLELIIKLKCKNIQLIRIKEHLLTKYFD